LLFFQKYKRYIIALLSIAALLTGCAGHGSATAAPGEKTGASKSISAGETTKTAMPTPAPTSTPPKGTIVTGWVAGIPDYVPQFCYGSIQKETSVITEGRDSTMFSLSIRNVKKVDLDQYAAVLRKNGFSVAVADLNTVYTLTASLDSGNDTATLIVSLTTSNGTAFYSLATPG
jgi:hypothetical protein